MCPHLSLISTGLNIRGLDFSRVEGAQFSRAGLTQAELINQGDLPSSSTHTSVRSLVCPLYRDTNTLLIEYPSCGNYKCGQTEISVLLLACISLLMPSHLNLLPLPHLFRHPSSHLLSSDYFLSRLGLKALLFDAFVPASEYTEPSSSTCTVSTSGRGGDREDWNRSRL